ncbi:hypothetical protein F5Y13DRAFT_200069 [Hypoxylon sp. FL1857]|nr:hypothetical protein F5Y13DRAFT_200069 [Hypoxylon sp. FL1857]
MDQAYTAGGRGRRGYRGRGRGRGYRGSRDSRDDTNSATATNPDPHSVDNSSQALSDLQNSFTRLSQRFQDVKKQLEEKKSEFIVVNMSHATLQQKHIQLQAELDLAREQHHQEVAAWAEHLETMEREFEAKEKTMMEQMAALNLDTNKPRSFNDSEVMAYLDRTTDFFYELLRVQVAKTDAVREQLAAVTQENAALRAGADSTLGGGASK